MSQAMLLDDSNDPGEATAAFHTETPDIARRVIAYVLENFAEEIRLEDMAAAAGMTRFNFCRRFHRDCGLPPVRWLWNFRVILAHEFIALDPRWSLTDVAFACGFTSSAHFSRSFKGVFKVSPSKFRKDQLANGHRVREPSPSMEALYGGESAILDAAMRRSLTLVTTD